MTNHSRIRSRAVPANLQTLNCRAGRTAVRPGRSRSPFYSALPIIGAVRPHSRSRQTLIEHCQTKLVCLYKGALALIKELVKLGTSLKSPARHAGPRGRWLFLLLLALSLAFTARADFQFDVFIGYGDQGGGGLAPEAGWFPVVCEIKNDGPTFVGVIEISSGNFNQGQTRRMVVELPTGTLKRVSIPVYSTSPSHYQSSWDVRLLDERGHLRAPEHTAVPVQSLSSGTTLLGALPRAVSGTPIIRQITTGDNDLQPKVARFVESAVLPDNPLVWESMDSFYINSEKALDLNQDQQSALLAWLNAGGHLIVGVEAISDVNETPWLRDIVPFNLTGQRSVTSHSGLQDWLRAYPAGASTLLSSKPRPMNMAGGTVMVNGVMTSVSSLSSSPPFTGLTADPDFESAELLVSTGTPRNGRVLAAAGDTPLVVTAPQGRGSVTVLLFNPERNPMRSWKNLPTFWAVLAGAPPELYVNQSGSRARAYESIDGVFGAMIDSKQIRKLPVEWLLLLLILYLLVIGPLDQYWLKRLKRPMLTWITFPCYVVLFSLMIYFIGYKLRAGETEWNELHFVDVLRNHDAAELRGRTFASIYSPVNATYHVESQQEFSTFRGEFQGGNNGSQDEHAEVLQSGNNFRAGIYVPVWTSQLYSSDWWQPADLPFNFTVVADRRFANDSAWTVTVNNLRDHPLTNVRLILNGRVQELGEIPAGQTRTFNLPPNGGTDIASFVRTWSSNFRNASQSRQHAFGNTGSAHIADLPDSSMALSLLSAGNQDPFILPPGLDLSAAASGRDQAVLLAWEAGYSPTKPINQFPTRRSHKDTLWRMVAPVTTAAAP